MNNFGKTHSQNIAQRAVCYCKHAGCDIQIKLSLRIR